MSDIIIPLDQVSPSCRFLTEDLRIALDNRTNITLGEINHSLEKALAATFWYGTYTRCSALYPKINSLACGLGNNVNYSSSHAINGLIKPENAYTYMNIPILNMTVNNTNEIPQHGEATILVLVQRLRLNVSCPWTKYTSYLPCSPS